MANTKNKNYNRNNFSTKKNMNNKKNNNKTYNLNNTNRILKQDIVNRKRQFEKNINNNIEPNNNFTNQVSAKERNRQKYENRQKRYANNKNNNKTTIKTINIDLGKIELVDGVIKKDEKYINNKNINNKYVNKKFNNKNINQKPKILNVDTGNIQIVNEKIQREEKERQKLKKIVGEKFPLKKKDFKPSIEQSFRLKRQKLINSIKEKHDDKKIPLGSLKGDNKARVKRYLKESLIYAVIITIINFLAILIFDYVNYLKLFDIVILNYVITIILSLIVSYAFAFFLDCLITEIWAKIKNKHKEGDTSGDSRAK